MFKQVSVIVSCLVIGTYFIVDRHWQFMNLYLKAWNDCGGRCKITVAPVNCAIERGCYDACVNDGFDGEQVCRNECMKCQ